MPVHVLIPGPLQPYANGRGRIALTSPPTTVAEALDLVAALHPGVRDRVLTEQGEVRPHIAIFVGGRDIRDGAGLSTRVPDGSEIAILPAVSGG